MMIDVFLILASYLLGSVSFSYLLVKLSAGHDVRAVGSGNPGATNALRAAGKLVGISVLVLDVAKGALPALVTRAMGRPEIIVGAVAVAVVVGHVFPLFLGFRGGKGVATAAGALGALAPVPLLFALAVFVVLVALTRYVSLGSMAAAVAFVPAAWLSNRLGWTEVDPWVILAGGLIAVLVLVRHRGNLSRLVARRERRLGERKEASS